MSESRAHCALVLHPGFDDSLRLLVERERYSFTDIAMMFGVSYQNVDQWCRVRGIRHPDAGIQRGTFAIRLWDDSAHRFQPQHRKSFTRARIAAVRRLRMERRERVKRERQARIVSTASALRRQLGRAPTWAELAAALGLRAEKNSVVYVINHWAHPREGSSRERMHQLCLAIGVPHLGPGKKRPRSPLVSPPEPDHVK